MIVKKLIYPNSGEYPNIIFEQCNTDTWISYVDTQIESVEARHNILSVDWPVLRRQDLVNIIRGLKFLLKFRPRGFNNVLLYSTWEKNEPDAEVRGSFYVDLNGHEPMMHEKFVYSVYPVNKYNVSYVERWKIKQSRKEEDLEKHGGLPSIFDEKVMLKFIFDLEETLEEEIELNEEYIEKLKELNKDNPAFWEALNKKKEQEVEPVTIN